MTLGKAKLMKLGDFSNLAGHYNHRPAYSDHLIDTLLLYVNNGAFQSKIAVADIGAGTGKLTRMLADRKLDVTAVEPNDAMREEGIKHTADCDVTWLAGSGEKTGLPDSAFTWVTMASAFHWTDPGVSLPEFHRILKAGGYFTAVWNPRHIEKSKLHSCIESKIYEIAPDILRVSSGSKQHTQKWEEVLLSTGHFTDVILMEVDHTERMSPERYLGAWRSVNDIQAQAGPERWQRIMEAIAREIEGLDVVEVPYKNRAWTARKVT